jgi:hypothetical protein
MLSQPMATHDDPDEVHGIGSIWRLTRRRSMAMTTWSRIQVLPSLARHRSAQSVGSANMSHTLIGHRLVQWLNALGTDMAACEDLLIALSPEI